MEAYREKRVKRNGIWMKRDTARKLAMMSGEKLWENIYALRDLIKAYEIAEKLTGHAIAHERVIKHWHTMEKQYYSELVGRGLI